jgi:hypothetical protein
VIRIKIKATEFIGSLATAFSWRRNRACKGYLHSTGQSLATGDTMHLATIMNCQNVHWVMIMIDFPALTIWHGNSLGWRLDLEHKKLLDWWLSEYTINKFTYCNMPITCQSDSFLCGILAWNALLYFFLLEQHPLMHPSNVVAERLWVLLYVCNYQ